MGDHVAVTVRSDARPSVSDADKLRVFGYAALMIRSFFICVCVGGRVLLVNQSAFDNHGVFAKSSIGALIGIALTFVVMLTRFSQPIDVSCGTFCKFIGGFSAYLAPFSLLMVLVLPPELNWIGYLVVCVMFGIIFTCFFYLDDHQLDYRPSPCNNLVLLLIFLFAFLGVFFPLTSPDWVLYTVVYVPLSMENAYQLVTYLMFIYRKTRKPKAQQPIQQVERESNNDPPSTISYLMFPFVLSSFICIVMSFGRS